MSSVRAKFKCVQVTQNEAGYRVRLEPVTGENAENKEFFKWTPSGQCEMGIINTETAKQFIIGKEYYLDFTPVD